MSYEPTKRDLAELDQAQAILAMTRVCNDILANEADLHHQVLFEALRDRMTKVIQERWEPVLENEQG